MHGQYSGQLSDWKARCEAAEAKYAAANIQVFGKIIFMIMIINLVMMIGKITLMIMMIMESSM